MLRLPLLIDSALLSVQLKNNVLYAYRFQIIEK